MGRVGCFIINIQNISSGPLGPEGIYNKGLTLFITQHSRDVLLMESIIKYLDCGQVLKKSSISVVDFNR